MLYLTTFEEEPEHPLDPEDELLSVWPTVLSLKTDGCNIIPLKRTTWKILKGEILHLGLNKFLKKRREWKGTYPMSPLGGKLPETRITCSSRGSVKDRPEVLMLGMHFDMSIWSWYSLLLSLKVKVKLLKLSWCTIHANSCPLLPLRCIDGTK